MKDAAHRYFSQKRPPVVNVIYIVGITPAEALGLTHLFCLLFNCSSASVADRWRRRLVPCYLCLDIFDSGTTKKNVISILFYFRHVLCYKESFFFLSNGTSALLRREEGGGGDLKTPTCF